MSKCGAPCIVNVSMGFRLVYCHEIHGHMGEHTCQIPDYSRTPYMGTQATVKWSYTGNTAGDAGVSAAKPISERCNCWVHSKDPLKLEASRKKDPSFYDPLFTLLPRDGDRTSFCCEQNAGHEGGHARSGVFSPLGMKWRISW